LESDRNKKVKMKTGIGLRVIGIGMMILAGCVNADGEPAAEKPTPKPIPHIAISRGINLGNWLEAPQPGEWGVEIAPWHFTAIHEAGFDSVRIPVRFSAHANPQPPYTLDADFMVLVDDAVQQGLQNGLQVILDFHHYEEMMETPADHTERFLAIWQQLAERYREAPDTLYFELLNEPHGQLDANQWNELLAKAVAEIRVSNPERWIIVGGVDFNHVHSLDGLQLPEGERLIATFHYYEPFQFTHQGAPWVAGAEQWSGVQWTGTEEEKQAIVQMLDEALEWSQRHGIPLLMGEFGAITKADASSRQIWTAFAAEQAQRRGFGWIYWDLCGEFRVMDCESGDWDQPLLDALMITR
jgi:endoglucanase